MRKSIGLVLAALMATCGTVNAQDDQSPNPQSGSGQKADIKSDSSPKFTPIEIRQGGSDHVPTQDFYHEGVKLQSYQELKTVIDPLDDPEANRLLQSSAAKETAGTIFMVGAGLLAAGGFIYSFTATGTSTTTTGPFGISHTQNNAPDFTPSWVLGGSAVALGLIGLVFEGNAGQCRRDAVTRYNHLVEPDKNLSLFLPPHSGPPGLELTQRF